MADKNMEKFELTGGARIGMANATWPFATLKVSKDKLEVNASIIGKLVFTPNDIVSIKPYTGLTLVGKGIKINHRVANYSNEVIFWTFKNPSVVIHQITRTGFLDGAHSNSGYDHTSVVEQQRQGGFPVKKPVAIGVIVGWNILFISDIIRFATSGGKGTPLGNGAIIAMAGLLLMAVLSLLSKDFCKLILKEGRSKDDISKFLYLIIFISGFMLLQLFLFRSWSEG